MVALTLVVECKSSFVSKGKWLQCLASNGKARHLLATHDRTLNEWQLLTDAPNGKSVRNIVGSGQSASVRRSMNSCR